jgi:hypothetical protein
LFLWSFNKYLFYAALQLFQHLLDCIVSLKVATLKQWTGNDSKALMKVNHTLSIGLSVTHCL